MNLIQGTRVSLFPRLFACAAFLIVMVAVLTVQGCTVRLIGDYDDTIDKGITDVQQRAELYFAKLRSTSATPFDQSFHDDINARLVVLKSRATSLPKYSIIAQQIAALQTTFADFQTIDKTTPRPLVNDITTKSPPLVSNTESAVTTSVESILTLELKLKRGDTPAAKSSAAH